MAFVRRYSVPRGAAVTSSGILHEEKRRAIRSTVLGVGTLACPQCDAPVAIGERPLPVGTRLVCPFCLHDGPARDFLSLAAPARPTRVIVRLSGPGVTVTAADAEDVRSDDLG